MRFPTITRNNDFRRAYGRGKSFVGYSLVVYVVKNRNLGTRVGITSSKKIGNAVQRNRARRVIRAAVDMVVPREGVGNVDLILVARSSTAAQKSTQVAALLKKLLTRAGMLKEAAAQTNTPSSKKEDTPSQQAPVPEEASGGTALCTPLTTSASEPAPQTAPLQRPKGDDR